jgi:hypothetical protein
MHKTEGRKGPALTDHPHVNGSLTDIQRQHLEALGVPHWFAWTPYQINEKEPRKSGKAPMKPKAVARGVFNGAGYGSTSDPESTGGSLTVAMSAMKRGHGGVGLALKTAPARMVVLDMDHVRCPDTGEVNRLGGQLLERLAGHYVEVSPSGSGLRAVMWADDIGTLGVKKIFPAGAIGPDGEPSAVEIYPAGCSGYTRMTGALVAGVGVALVSDGQAVIDWVWELRTEKDLKAAASSSSGGLAAGFAALAQRWEVKPAAEVLASMKAYAASNPRSKLAEALRGNAKPWNSDASSLDFYLFCECVRRGCGTLEAVREVADATGAKRAKWDEKRGSGTVFSEGVSNAIRAELSSAQKGKGKAQVPAHVKANVEAVAQAGQPVATATSSGKAKATLSNVVAIMRARHHGVFAYDEFRRIVYRTRSLSGLDKFAATEPGPINDDDYTRVTLYLEREFGMEITQGDMVRKAVQALARDCRYNPVAAVLKDCADEWRKSEMCRAGQSLLDTWLVRLMGVDDTGCEEYVRRVSRCCLIQAAARVLIKGAEVHTMPVFSGHGGDGKGHLLKALAEVIGPGLFTSQSVDLGKSRDVVELLSASLICEWAELKPSKDSSAFKSAMTQQEDRHRKAYGIESESHPRLFTVWATTNEAEIITDPSQGEARRLWPTFIPRGRKADAIGLSLVGRLLWGEAVAAALDGERHFIHDVPEDAEAFGQWQRVIEGFRVSDPLDDAVRSYVADWVTQDGAGWMEFRSSKQIADAIGLSDGELGHAKKGDWQALNRALTALQLKKTTSGHLKVKGWLIPGDARRQIAESLGLEI